MYNNFCVLQHFIWLDSYKIVEHLVPLYPEPAVKVAGNLQPQVVAVYTPTGKRYTSEDRVSWEYQYIGVRVLPVPKQPSAWAVATRCTNCTWTGIILDCQPDVDGEGSLGCPRCNSAVELNVPSEK